MTGTTPPAVPDATRYTNREPVFVDAIRWTGDNEEAIMAFVGEVSASSERVGFKTWDQPGFTVIRSTVDESLVAQLWNSAQGDWVSVAVGWYVVRGITGHLFTLTGEQFTDVYDPAPASPKPPAAVTAAPEPVSEASVDAALNAVARYWKEAHAVLQCYPSRDLARVMLEAGASLIRADEWERLRTHEHEWTRCPECKQPGQPCPCSGVPCCEMERRETLAANEATRDERERIAQLADRVQAACTGDEGTSCYFSALIRGGMS